MDILIERAQQNQLEAVAEIEKDNFSKPWSLQSFQDAYEMEQVVFLTAKADNKVVGYALMYFAFDEGEIPTIAVDCQYRRQHIAQTMLQEIFLEAKKMQVSHIYLEVRQSNESAISLYRHMGFVPVGTRRDFYQNPTESAMVMVAQVLQPATE